MWVCLCVCVWKREGKKWTRIKENKYAFASIKCLPKDTLRYRHFHCSSSFFFNAQKSKKMEFMLASYWRKRRKRAAKRAEKMRAHSHSHTRTHAYSVNDLQSYYIYYNMWSICAIQWICFTHTHPLFLSVVAIFPDYFFFSFITIWTSFCLVCSFFYRTIQNRLLIHFRYYKALVIIVVAVSLCLVHSFVRTHFEQFKPKSVFKFDMCRNWKSRLIA